LSAASLETINEAGEAYASAHVMNSAAWIQAREAN